MLTASVLDGLAGDADVDGDEVVRVVELFEWVSERVDEGTRGTQSPTVEVKHSAADLPLTGGVGTDPAFGFFSGFELLRAGYRIVIDGAPRGGGAVLPGSRVVEVLDGDRLLARERVEVNAGERVDLGPILDHHRAHWAVGVGLGIGGGGLYLPDQVMDAGLGYRPAQAGVARVQLVARVGAGQATVADARLPTVEGTFGGGVAVVPEGPIEIGVELGGGLVARRPARGWERAPAGRVAVVGRVHVGAVALSLAGEAAVVSAEGGLAIGARGRGGVEWWF